MSPAVAPAAAGWTTKTAREDHQSSNDPLALHGAAWRCMALHLFHPSCPGLVPFSQNQLLVGRFCLPCLPPPITSILLCYLWYAYVLLTWLLYVHAPSS